MTDPETQRVMASLPGLPPDKIMAELLRIFVCDDFYENHPDLIQQILENMTKYPTTAHGQKRQFGSIQTHNTYERLPEIKVPTLVIAGDADKIIPVENSRIIASRIPGAELVILKNMGHMFVTEAADESNRIMLGFLKRHSKSGKGK
jgi:pimeloyl-ACP methyl ester carboxylesterase